MLFLLGTFFEISEENISTTLGYTKGLIVDLTPILLPIIGIMVGLIIFWAIMRAIRGGD